MENLIITSINVEDLIERISTRVYEKIMNLTPTPGVGLEEPQVVDEHQKMVKLLNTPLERFELRTHLLNHLRKWDRHEDHYEFYETLGNIASLKEEKILKLRNVGKTGVEVLRCLLKQNGLDFGMDLSGYKIKPPRTSSRYY